MRLRFHSDWPKNSPFLRYFDLIPSIGLCLDHHYKFESLRMSWIGFTVVIGK